MIFFLSSSIQIKIYVITKVTYGIKWRYFTFFKKNDSNYCLHKLFFT